MRIVGIPPRDRISRSRGALSSRSRERTPPPLSRPSAVRLWLPLPSIISQNCPCKASSGFFGKPILLGILLFRGPARSPRVRGHSALSIFAQYFEHSGQIGKFPLCQKSPDNDASRLVIQYGEAKGLRNPIQQLRAVPHLARFFGDEDVPLEMGDRWIGQKDGHDIFP